MRERNRSRILPFFVTLTIILLIVSTTPAALASPDERDLNSTERANVESAISFLRRMGDDDDADEVQNLLNNDKIKVDSGLDCPTAKLDGTVVLPNTSVGPNPFSSTSEAARLASTIVHENVHRGQGALYRASNNLIYSVCLGKHYVELEAWYKVINSYNRWINKLLDEYYGLAPEFNGKIADFNQRIGPPEQYEIKEELLEDVLEIERELEDHLQKAREIRDLISDARTLLKDLKGNNYEKGDYKGEEQLDDLNELRDWINGKVSQIESAMQRAERWIAWIENDPPGNPGPFENLEVGALLPTQGIEAALEEAENERLRWEAAEWSERLVYLNPFFSEIARYVGGNNDVNVHLYLDTTFSSPAYMETITFGLGVENGEVDQFLENGFSSPDVSVQTSESAMIKVLAAGNPAAEFAEMISQGRIVVPTLGEAEVPTPSEGEVRVWQGIAVVTAVIGLILGYLLASRRRAGAESSWTPAPGAP